jgi:hypothetical protein
VPFYFINLLPTSLLYIWILLGGSLTTGRHKDICRVLSKWREVVKDGVAPDSCTADMVAFLQRLMRDALKTQRERQRQFSHNGGPGRRTVTGCQGGDAGERGEWQDE